MSDFIQPSAKYDSWARRYSCLDGASEQVISCLKETLPHRYTSEVIEENQGNESHINQLIESFLSEIGNINERNIFTFAFLNSSICSELCNKDEIELLWASIDWSQVVSHRLFFMPFQHGVRAAFIQKKLFFEEGPFLIYLRSLPKETQIKFCRTIEAISGMQPFFSNKILSNIMEIDLPIEIISDYCIWMIGLPKEILGTVFEAASGGITHVPDDLRYSDNNTHHLILPYGLNSELLNAIYEGIPEVEVIDDILSFLYERDSENWYIPFTVELEMIAEDDYLPQLIQENQSDVKRGILLKYLIERAKGIPKKDIEKIILELLCPEEGVFEVLDDLFVVLKPEEGDDLIQLLVDVAISEEFGERVVQESNHYSHSAVYPKKEYPLRYAFLKALIEEISSDFNPRYIPLMLLYWVPVESYIQGQLDDRYSSIFVGRHFQFFFINVISRKDRRIDELQQLFAFSNITLSRDDRESLLIWQDWCIKELFRTDLHACILSEELGLNVLSPRYLEAAMHTIENPIMKLLEPLATVILENIHHVPNTLNTSRFIELCLFSNARPDFDKFVAEHFDQFSNISRLHKCLIALSERENYSDDEILSLLIENDMPLGDDVFKIFEVSEIRTVESLTNQIRRWKHDKGDIRSLLRGYRSLLQEPGNILESELNDLGIKFLHELVRNIPEEVLEDRFPNELQILSILLSKQNINELDDNEKKIIVSSAQRIISMQRAILRGKSTVLDINCVMSAADTSYNLIALLQGRSKALMNGLTNFRHVPISAINSDLNPFRVSQEELFTPLPQFIHRIIEVIDDDEGLDIRRDLADYFSKRLNLNKKYNPSRAVKQPDHIGIHWDGWAPEYMEPDPIWRYAYVKAIEDLGIHARGKGQFYGTLMKKISDNDPSQKVREAAIEAYGTLNAQRKGFASGSSKRRLLHAWWWIRQAHILTTGAIPDPEGAQKTRFSEVRRTS